MPSDDEFLKSEAGRRRVEKMAKKTMADLRVQLTRGKISDAKKAVKTSRRNRGRLRKKLEQLLTKRQVQNETGKVKKHCGQVRMELRQKYEERVSWLQNKYITKP